MSTELEAARPFLGDLFSCACVPSIDIPLPSLSSKRTQRKGNFLFIKALFDLQNHCDVKTHGNALL